MTETVGDGTTPPGEIPSSGLPTNFPPGCAKPTNSPQVALNQQSSYCGHCDLVSLLYPSLSTSYDAKVILNSRTIAMSTSTDVQESEIGGAASFWTPPLPQIDPEDPLLSNIA